MPREKTFRFKQFAVVNDRTAMKVGTDGVLLGSWCTTRGARRVLDVGTGCGLIALMIAQRAPQATVVGIDIDSDAVEEARLNFAHSQWDDRLTAHCVDFNVFAAEKPFDLIVSNPPFFEGGLEAPDAQRNTARHTTTLSYDRLIDYSAQLLSDNGVLSLIAPAWVQERLLRTAAARQLYLSRLTRVIPVAGREPKRILCEFTLHDCTPQIDELVIRDVTGTYTPEYTALTGEFYIK